MLLNSQSDATQVNRVVGDAGLSIAQFYRGLVSLADEVGDLLRQYYAAPESLETTAKADQSPITAADHAAHVLISERLQSLTPAVPILSEESAAADIRERLSWPVVWVVDPLDGTREFIDRTDEFTCNIALVVEHRPVVGLISLPVRRQHYLGVVGLGAVRLDQPGSLEGQPLETPRLDRGRPLRLLASARHKRERVHAVMDRLRPMTGAVTRVDAGSAVKFCRLVEGAADVYPRTSPCYEWDVAAGDALVCAAGGKVTNYAGQPLRYNARDSLLSESFIAASDPSVSYTEWLCGPDDGASGLSPSQPRS
ncbi:MAG: 3'(2'),5'-bisphosphate nucleotidase CysQ [Halieaceae bacterium]|jgi:3'(2'), 5'-bisphosphate nucleotidase|nr:3'(2'),5'-bisphosphate nucleotidase CysQ [Halieaceae bacterium]